MAYVEHPLEPMDVLRRDGVYEVRNPADAEPSDEAVDKLIKAIKSQNPREYLVGREFEAEFIIDKSVAQAIMRVYDTDKLNDTTAADYTMATVKDITMLIARDKQGICLWTIELPKEIPDMIENAHFEEDLAAFREMNESYKKIRTKGIVLFMLLLAMAGVVYAAAWKLSGVPVMLWR